LDPEIKAARERGMQSNKAEMQATIEQGERDMLARKFDAQEAELGRREARAGIQADRMHQGRDEDQGDQGALPAINSFVDPHKKWLLSQLYEGREEEGDVVLVFSTAAGSGDAPTDDA